MEIGDWVFGVYDGKKITGFITGFTDGKYRVYVTIPNSIEDVLISESHVQLHNDIVVWMDDIPTLIDLSLAIKDKEWFEKWAREYALWTPAQTLEHLC